MQAVRDQGGFKLGNPVEKRNDFRSCIIAKHGVFRQQVKPDRLFEDRVLQATAFIMGNRVQCAPPVERVLDVQKAAIKTGMADGRRKIADESRCRPPAGDCPLGGVVGSIKIDVRHCANKPVRPALSGNAGLFSRHEFKRAMGAEMQHGIRAESSLQIGIERDKGMCGCKAVFEQQPHWVAFIAESRLDADKQVSEMAAQNEDAAAIRLNLARRRAPLGLDLRQPWFGPDVIVARNMSRDIGDSAVTGRIALQDHRTQRVRRLGNLDAITVGSQCLHGVVQGGEHVEIGCSSRGSAIGREIEQDRRKLALRFRLAAQPDKACRPFRQHFGPLGTGHHVEADALALEGTIPVAAGASGPGFCSAAI